MPRSEKSGKASAKPARAPSPPRDPDAREARDAGGLDRYDIALLGELQRDARQSNADLAARIGLSPAPTWRRVRRLEELGVITGYRAEIDRRKIGLGVLAFVRVDAERDNADATRVLEDAIRGLPEVPTDARLDEALTALRATCATRDVTLLTATKLVDISHAAVLAGLLTRS